LATAASTHTHALERAGAAPPAALAAGFARAFLLAGCLGIVAFAAVPSATAPPSAADH
jgi:hypothetical protein